MHHHKTTQHARAHTDGVTMQRVGFYDLITGILFRGRERRFRQSLINLVGLSPGEHVLDIGCGTGTLALLAKEVTGPEGVVVGLDADPKILQVARQKQEKRGLDVYFEQGLIQNLPFTDNHFNVVFSTLMMHHLPDDIKQQGLAEIRRVLMPDGRLLIVDFSFHMPSLAALFHGHRDDEDRSQTMSALVREAGFSQVQPGWTSLKSAFYVMGMNTTQ